MTLHTVIEEAKEEVLIFTETDGVGVCVKRVGEKYSITVSGTKEYFGEIDISKALTNTATKAYLEALAKVEEWVKELRKQHCGKKDCEQSICATRHHNKRVANDLLHHLQQLKDNK